MTFQFFRDTINLAWLAGQEGKIEDKLYGYQLQVYWSETSTTGSGCCMELINVEIYKVKFYESTDSFWCITTSLLHPCCCPAKPPEVIYYTRLSVLQCFFPKGKEEQVKIKYSFLGLYFAACFGRCKNKLSRTGESGLKRCGKVIVCDIERNKVVFLWGNDFVFIKVENSCI